MTDNFHHIVIPNEVSDLQFAANADPSLRSG